MHGHLAISFAKIEILNEKVLDMRVFCDRARSIGDITESFFSQIVGIHIVKKPIIRIGIIVLVFWLDSDKAIFTTVW